MVEPLHLTPLQQAAAVAGSIGLLLFVIYLIYRGRLREDYGALWLAAATATVIFALWQDGLRLLAATLDAVTLTAPIFLLSILFLTVIAIHFSVRFTTLSAQVQHLAREIALLRAREHSASPTPSAPSGAPPTSSRPLGSDSPPHQ
jgi:hypothetical protein